MIHLFSKELWQGRMEKVSVGIACSHCRAALSGEGWAQWSTQACGSLERGTEPGQPWAAPALESERGSRHVGSWACTILHCGTGPREGRAPPPPAQIVLLELWKINTELLMIKPADCGESVRASTLEGYLALETSSKTDVAALQLCAGSEEARNRDFKSYPFLR